MATMRFTIMSSHLLENMTNPTVKRDCSKVRTLLLLRYADFAVGIPVYSVVNAYEYVTSHEQIINAS